VDDFQKDLLTAEDKSEQQRGRPFQAGQSGNPKGRPKGSRNKATLVAEALLDGDAGAIMRKLVEKAKEGDPTALRLCLERLLPPRRDRLVAFDFHEIKSSDDALKASSSVLAACADGALSPDEASKVMGLIASHANLLELTELEARLAAVEQQVHRP
jgi:hypothetical protein